MDSLLNGFSKNIFLFCKQKLSRRVVSLDKSNWTTSAKASMAEVLYEDYMSSEESDAADGSSVRVYKAKKLAWESRKLAERKAKLDKI